MLTFLTSIKFFLFTTLGVASVLVVTLSNPIYAVLCLILLFISASLILVLNYASFIALLYILVYVGAVLILFLWVVMTIPLKKNTTLHLRFFIFLLFFLFFLFFYFNLTQSEFFKIFFFTNQNGLIYSLFILFLNEYAEVPCKTTFVTLLYTHIIASDINMMLPIDFSSLFFSKFCKTVTTQLFGLNVFGYEEILVRTLLMTYFNEINNFNYQYTLEFILTKKLLISSNWLVFDLTFHDLNQLSDLPVSENWLGLFKQNRFQSIEILAKLLYNDFGLCLIIAALILIVAMIGAIMLVFVDKDLKKSQLIEVQLLR